MTEGLESIHRHALVPLKGESGHEEAALSNDGSGQRRRGTTAEIIGMTRFFVIANT